VRVNFNYFISEEVFRFVLDAVHLVAAEGWRLLPQYDFDPATGLWHHRDGPAEPRLSLFDISYGPEGMEYPRHRTTGGVEHLDEYLEQARAILTAAEAPSGEIPRLDVGPDFEHLRWFPLPGEREEATGG
jgi:hypothetical protein